jgi:hypothetical protein
MPMNGTTQSSFVTRQWANRALVVRITTGVKLRGAEGAQRLRATSASTTELCRFGFQPPSGSSDVLSQPPRSRILQDTILGAAVNCLLHRTECASKGQCSVMTACPGQVPTTHQAVSSIGLPY